MDSNLSNLSNMDKLISIANAYHSMSKDVFTISEVNHLLLDTYIPDDFNAFPAPLRTQSDFRTAVNAAIAARDDPKAPWLKWECTCGKPITITHRELNWRRLAKIPLPCMCDECIAKALGRACTV